MPNFIKKCSDEIKNDKKIALKILVEKPSLFADFENYILRGSKLPETNQLFEPNWFVTKNFHGHFYLDYDKLENIFHHL